MQPVDAEECKQNISFVFEDKVYRNFEDFQAGAAIDGTRVWDLEEPIEIVRAGILDGLALLKTPWGDKRLTAKGINP